MAVSWSSEKLPVRAESWADLILKGKSERRVDPGEPDLNLEKHDLNTEVIAGMQQTKTPAAISIILLVRQRRFNVGRQSTHVVVQTGTTSHVLSLLRFPLIRYTRPSALAIQALHTMSIRMTVKRGYWILT